MVMSFFVWAQHERSPWMTVPMPIGPNVLVSVNNVWSGCIWNRLSQAAFAAEMMVNVGEARLLSQLARMHSSWHNWTMKVSQPPLAPGWLPTVPPSLSPAHKFWLMRPGALTVGLRQLGTVRLRVLNEYAQGAPADEARGLGIMVASPVWVREIMMSIDGVDSVVGRSLTPLTASHGVWQGMRRLRTRPLADMLFHDPSVQRSAFACRLLAWPVPFHATVRAIKPEPAGALWARRSTFWRQGQPLLVAECFLPAFWNGGAPADCALPCRQ